MSKIINTGTLLTHQGRDNNIWLIGNNSSRTKISQPPKGVRIELFGSGNTIELSHNMKIYGELIIDIRGNNNLIVFGDSIIIRRSLHCCIHPGGPGVHSDECTLTIGTGTIFNGRNITLQIGEEKTNISIGKDCLFASNIRLMTSDNHLLYDQETGERLNIAGDIIIGDHCWICFDCVLLNHSKVPSGSVVAARSLVNRDFNNQNVLLAGTPAKIIRRNIGWKISLAENIGDD